MDDMQRMAGRNPHTPACAVGTGRGRWLALVVHGRPRTQEVIVHFSGRHSLRLLTGRVFSLNHVVITREIGNLCAVDPILSLPSSGALHRWVRTPRA
jgi:hypothetical protein